MTQVQRIADGPVLAKLSPSDDVWRSFDAADINPILNDPSVFPAISFPTDTSFDATELLANPMNVLMMADGGGILFCIQEPGIYEVHTNFLPSYRGRHAIRASLNAYRWMFTHTNCMALQTRVPQFNKGADLAARLVGFRLEFERAQAWPTKEGQADLKFYTMRVHDWIWNTPSLAASGVRFHARLDEERKRFNLTEENHPDDHAHDVAVGACAEMTYGGEPEKAIAIYNAWARFAGYGTISLVSKNPVILDIGSAVLQIANDSFRILLCR